MLLFLYYKGSQPADALLLSDTAAVLPLKGYVYTHCKGIHERPYGKKDCFLYVHHI